MAWAMAGNAPDGAPVCYGSRADVAPGLYGRDVERKAMPWQSATTRSASSIARSEELMAIGMMRRVSVRIAVPRAKLAEVLDVLQCLKGATEVSKGCRVCRVL